MSRDVKKLISPVTAIGTSASKELLDKFIDMPSAPQLRPDDAEMPQADEEALALARKRRVLAARNRGGRASTFVKSDKLG